MNSILKPINEIKFLLIFYFCVLFLIAAVLFLDNEQISSMDYKLLDIYQSFIVDGTSNVAKSSNIIYATIDDSTYINYFNLNQIDRIKFARSIDLISELNPAAILLDIIFKYPSGGYADSLMSLSLLRSGKVFLPVGFLANISGSDCVPVGYDPKNSLETFNNASAGLGHVTVTSSSDGITRTYYPIIKYNNKIFPSLPLAAFLMYNEVPLDSIIIEKGKRIIIPKLKSSWLNEDVIIPIDDEGRTFIPYVGKWENDFDKISLQNISKYFKSDYTRSELYSKFEGRFVFVGDISDMSADIGKTPLEENSFKISTHSAVLNSLINNQFYYFWSVEKTILFFVCVNLILAFMLIIRSNKYFYIFNIVVLLGGLVFTYYQMINLSLFPLFKFLISTIVLNLSAVVFLEITTSKQKKFVKNAFSRFVSPEVVNQLIQKPSLLKLHGEEKNITILFSDLVNFTSISENMEPQKLVELLNNCFTQLTDVVIKNGGTIDKFLGDGIMALFGAPLELENNSESAVKTAVEMQKVLTEMNKINTDKGLPELEARIGINCGNAIIGNLGSEQVFDYTAIGDAVNAASRLEGLNKFYDSSIIISEAVFNNLERDDPGYSTIILDKVRLKGKENSIVIYQVVIPGLNVVLDENYYSDYEEGVKKFLNKNIGEAKIIFNRILYNYPDDKNVNSFLKRISALEQKNNFDENDLVRVYFDK